VVGEMKFNETATGTKTVNRAGGQAYTQNPELALASLLLTSFLNDKFYESSGQQLDRLQNAVCGLADKKFAAKAAIFARTEFGMRSITHALAGELAYYVKGQEWTKDAIEKIVYRPDDMIEILAYYMQYHGKPIPNSLKKGFALALEKFDGYQLAKYRAEGKKIKLVDIINISHPVPADEIRAKLYKDILEGNLKSTGTWETKLTQAGQKAKTDEEKIQLKKDAWISLIDEKKIGYFALLRNMRNILEQAPEIITKACEMLIDEKLIKKSLVLPFRFATAIREIEQTSYEGTRQVLIALIKAMDISLSNVPVFDGKTCVVLDTSGSMSGKPIEIGSLFAAALYKSNNADLMMFSNDAVYMNINPVDSIYSISRFIESKAEMGGTNFHAIFNRLNKAYDRIIILSDMQGWIGYDSPVRDRLAYMGKFSCNPHTYSFDLNGYGDMQFPENSVYCIAGFSDKIFDIMKFLETDKNALINRIKAIEL
jgi:60 kDa SS-A/Ro ribonucleoprotein